jgi:hypothetical protein
VEAVLLPPQPTSVDPINVAVASPPRRVNKLFLAEADENLDFIVLKKLSNNHFRDCQALSVLIQLTFRPMNKINDEYGALKKSITVVL